MGTFQVNQRRPGKRGQKCQTKNFRFDYMIHFLSLGFHYVRKKWPHKAFWVARIEQNKKNVKIQKCQGIAKNVTIFDFHNDKTLLFLRYLPDIWYGYRYTRGSILLCVFRFIKNEKFSLFLMIFEVIFPLLKKTG